MSLEIYFNFDWSLVWNEMFLAFCNDPDIKSKDPI
jgi:hypothetical protein